MWVRSQDKKLLANFKSFSVTRNYLGGKKKFAIIGTISENSFWGSNTNSLGQYDTMNKALDELTKIQSALINNEKVYEMN